jgi:small subunit ribosomal protein S6
LPATAREYELVLMLDPEVPDERREQITLEARKRIESHGALKHDTTWGLRKLAYEIRQRTEADYRFFRFETDGELLDELNHSLRIADGVLRFRIFKVDAGSPAIVPPPTMASSSAARAPRRQPEAPRSQPAAAEDRKAEAEEAPEAEAPEVDEGPTAASDSDATTEPAEDAAADPAEDAE